MHFFSKLFFAAPESFFSFEAALHASTAPRGDQGLTLVGQMPRASAALALKLELGLARDGNRVPPASAQVIKLKSARNRVGASTLPLSVSR